MPGQEKIIEYLAVVVLGRFDAALKYCYSPSLVKHLKCGAPARHCDRTIRRRSVILYLFYPNLCHLIVVGRHHLSATIRENLPTGIPSFLLLCAYAHALNRGRGRGGPRDRDIVRSQLSSTHQL